ncbi:MAG: porphobilinogen synthase [Candidatus Omnitrophota bacterium]|nr:porphobilinogen synthase [Candidatus Omnitrophota bacterium]
MIFPNLRMRERRKDEEVRRQLRQTAALTQRDLIMPIFVKEGLSAKSEIKSMPGIYQFSAREAVGEAQRLYDTGIPYLILFGVPKHKDETASSAYDERGIIQEVIRSIKQKLPQLVVIADVCMCEYTSHGHCGIIKKTKEGFQVDNDQTLEILAKIALSYGNAGADYVAPSAMMDGQVKVIKEALMKNNLAKVKIMAYSAKYASSFYGPFREAAESSPRFGDRAAYQMDYYNSDEAILEAKLDIQEGADIIMVKPALAYQDIIYRIKDELNFPLACYSVSGEYAMIKLAAAKNLLDEKKIVLEILTGFKRSGADFIITYYAAEVAKWLKETR